MAFAHCRVPALSAAALLLALAHGGCGTANFNLFPDAADPLTEHTLEGTGHEKVLVIPVQGNISDSSKRGFVRSRPSLVQEVVSRLKKAEKDKRIGAVVLQVDSPGGTVTASDVLYHEIASFRERAKVPVVAALMKTATSGAYYISLPADYIMAHPTTVTGSTGVIFLRPKVTGLISKIGVEVIVSKSGKLKDMGSPFRPDTAEEREILQGMIDEFARRFIGLVTTHRNPGEAALATISTARVFLAEEARELGLVDGIGYLDDALARARQLGGLGEDARVVVYRRRSYPDDTLYNTAAAQGGSGELHLVDFGLPPSVGSVEAGFHYLWLPGVTGE
jgi:protease-4